MNPQITWESIQRPFLRRYGAMQQIENFVDQSVKKGCSREDVLNFLQANGIGYTPFIRRAQVLDNRAVVANPVPCQLFPVTVYKDLTGKTVAIQNNGATAHLVDEGKAIVTSDVTELGELGYKVEFKDGEVTKLSTVYPSYELTIGPDGKFVESSQSIQEQVAQHKSNTANLQKEIDALQKEVDASNDALRLKQMNLLHEFREKFKS